VSASDRELSEKLWEEEVDRLVRVCSEHRLLGLQLLLSWVQRPVGMLPYFSFRLGFFWIFWVKAEIRGVAGFPEIAFVRKLR